MKNQIIVILVVVLFIGASVLPSVTTLVKGVDDEGYTVLWEVELPIEDYHSFFQADSGDIDSDGKDEVAIISYEHEYGGLGDLDPLMLFDDDGSPLWSKMLLKEECSIAMEDYDLDGEAEIFVGATDRNYYNADGHIWGYEGDGSFIWEFVDTEDYGFWIIVPGFLSFKNIDSDDELEIIASNCGYPPKNNYAIDDDGSLTWRFDRGDALDVLHGDIDNDGDDEIILMTGVNRKVYAINPNDGSILWQISPINYNRGAVGDLTGDGIDDIFVVSKGQDLYSTDKIYAVRNDGIILWEKFINDDYGRYPILEDINYDGKKDIILNENNRILAWKNDGSEILWEVFAPHDIWQLYRFDINADGILDIIFFADNSVYYVSYDGDISKVFDLPVVDSCRELWSYRGKPTLEKSKYGTRLVSADTNGNGIREFFIEEAFSDHIKIKVIEPKGIERKALLISCWNYPHPMKDFPAAKNNIKSIKRLLWKGFDFKPKDITICKNPSKVELENDIIDLKSETENSDKKIIYYSGHGIKKSYNYGNGELCGTNEGINLSSSEFFWDNELSDYISIEENLAAVFDTCFSGGLCNDTDNTEDCYKDSDGKNGIDGDLKVIGMAANSDGFAISDDKDSFFTRFFIQAFTHYRDLVKFLIPGDNSRVSMEEALQFAETSTNLYTLTKQNPVIYDSYNEQFYLSDEPINNYWSFKSLCPVHLHGYNDLGNHIGINDTGDIENQISDALHSGISENEFIVLFDPDNNSYIQIVAEAYENGYFTLECQDYDEESQTTLTIVYDNIPIIETSVAYLLIEDGTFGNMEIDDDGDNIADRTIAPEILSSTGFFPSAKFTYEPTEPFIGADVTFNASSSFDFDGDIVEYYWQFGDGNIGYGATIEYSFTKAGPHEVNLTVTDDDGLSDITQQIVEVKIPAVIDIDPDVLNLIGKGKWITCYIELPEGYNVGGINISTILLNNIVSSENRPIDIGDYDNDGIPDLMVKFDKQDVIDVLEVGDNVEITVTGELIDGTIFEGVDYIRVI